MRGDRGDRPSRLLAHVAQTLPSQAHLLVRMVKRSMGMLKRIMRMVKRSMRMVKRSMRRRMVATLCAR